MANDLAIVELKEITLAGASALTNTGLDRQPVKAHMLKCDDADLIVQACDMLFAALLTYEDGLWKQERAENAIELVEARMMAGRARAVVEALFHGPTAQLLGIALDRAPIAYYELSEASPDLNIIDRTYAGIKILSRINSTKSDT
jgi:hypothetical protein